MSVATDMPLPLSPSKPEPDPSEEVKLYGDLLSVTTHDLRSPLGAIGIFCELLLSSEKPLDESQVKSVEMIAEAAAKAQRILEDASEVSRTYRGVLTLAQESLDLRDLFGEAISQVRPTAEARGVTVTVNFAPGKYEVLADPARTFQVALRLVEEAVVTSPKDGEVIVSGQHGEPGEVVVMVEQHGAERPGERSRRECETSLKGRLANRKPGESHYSLHMASRVASMMSSVLDYSRTGLFKASWRFPSPPQY